MNKTLLLFLGCFVTLSAAQQGAVVEEAPAVSVTSTFSFLNSEQRKDLLFSEKAARFLGNGLFIKWFGKAVTYHSSRASGETPFKRARLMQLFYLDQRVAVAKVVVENAGGTVKYVSPRAIQEELSKKFPAGVEQYQPGDLLSMYDWALFDWIGLAVTPLVLGGGIVGSLMGRGNARIGFGGALLAGAVLSWFATCKVLVKKWAKQIRKNVYPTVYDRDSIATNHDSFNDIELQPGARYEQHFVWKPKNEGINLLTAFPMAMIGNSYAPFFSHWYR